MSLVAFVVALALPVLCLAALVLVVVVVTDQWHDEPTELHRYHTQRDALGRACTRSRRHAHR